MNIYREMELWTEGWHITIKKNIVIDAEELEKEVENGEKAYLMLKKIIGEEFFNTIIIRSTENQAPSMFLGELTENIKRDEELKDSKLCLAVRGDKIIERLHKRAEELGYYKGKTTKEEELEKAIELIVKHIMNYLIKKEVK